MKIHLSKISNLLVLIAFSALLITGCSASKSEPSGGENSKPKQPQFEFKMPEEQAELVDNSFQEHYSVLIMGNSHSARLGDMLQKLILASGIEKSASMMTAPGIDYLDERAYDGISLSLLQNNEWTHTIFQAQKYSQSGKYVYSTHAAQVWVRLAKLKGATPIMFPEHPQKGNNREGRMVHRIHESIAEKEPACVSPVGLAWDEAIKREGSIRLHSSDGNHASQTGELLTAFVFYQIITGQPAVALPFIENVDTNAETQTMLKQVAGDTLALHPACE